MGNLKHDWRSVAVNGIGQSLVSVNYAIFIYFQHSRIGRNAVSADRRISRDDAPDPVLCEMLIF